MLKTTHQEAAAMQRAISWEEKLKLEKAYFETKGHLVPMSKEWFQGVPIGKWVDDQRQKKDKRGVYRPNRSKSLKT